MKDKEYSAVLKQLREVLPKDWEIRSVKREPRLRQSDDRSLFIPDLLVELEAPDGTRTTLVVEVKEKALEPRDVPKVVDQLRSYSAASAPLGVLGGVAAVGAAIGAVAWPLVAATFVSPRARELLTKLGAGYMDETGNLRLVLERPAVFVERAGSDRNPEPEERPLRSLKGPAAGRVVRALCDFPAPWRIRDLAERAGASVGSVARVLDLLERDAIVIRDDKDRRVTKVDWPALIRRWAQDYTFADPAGTGMYRAPRGLDQVFARLSTSDLDLEYALTGSCAASKVAPVLPPRLLTMYASDPDKAGETLDLRRAEVGANVMVVDPFDSVVFERTWKRDGVVFAALSQVAVDLLAGPGRGSEEAKELLGWMKENEQTWRER